MIAKVPLILDPQPEDVCTYTFYGISDKKNVC